MISDSDDTLGAPPRAAWLGLATVLLCLPCGCTSEPDSGSTTSGSTASGGDTSTSSEAGSASEDPSATDEASGSDPTTDDGSGSEATDHGDATGSSTNGSTSDDGSTGDGGSSTTGVVVDDCSECGADETCLMLVGFAEAHQCVPTPAACEGDVDCECGAVLCPDPFDMCVDPPRSGRLECHCPAC